MDCGRSRQYPTTGVTASLLCFISAFKLKQLVYFLYSAEGFPLPPPPESRPTGPHRLQGRKVIPPQRSILHKLSLTGSLQIRNVEQTEAFSCRRKDRSTFQKERKRKIKDDE